MEFEYLTIAVVGLKDFNKSLNEMARQGWELVNGGSGPGTTIFGFLRRKVRQT